MVKIPGKSKKPKPTEIDKVVQELRKKKVPDTLIIGQLASSMTEIVQTLLEKEDYNMLTAIHSHIKSVLLAPVEDALKILEKKKK